MRRIPIPHVAQAIGLFQQLSSVWRLLKKGYIGASGAVRHLHAAVACVGPNHRDLWTLQLRLQLGI